MSISAFLAYPSVSLAAKWSDFSIVEKVDGLEISYRSSKLKDGWSAEWKGENKGTDWGAPFSAARKYSCTDGKSQKIEKDQSMGRCHRVRIEECCVTQISAVAIR